MLFLQHIRVFARQRCSSRRQCAPSPRYRDVTWLKSSTNEMPLVFHQDIHAATYLLWTRHIVLCIRLPTGPWTVVQDAYGCQIMQMCLASSTCPSYHSEYGVIHKDQKKESSTRLLTRAPGQSAVDNIGQWAEPEGGGHGSRPARKCHEFVCEQRAQPCLKEKIPAEHALRNYQNWQCPPHKSPRCRNSCCEAVC